MSLFRPYYNSPVYQPAIYSTKDGKKLVRFRLPKTGNYVTGEVMPSGEAKVQSPMWYARIRKNGKTKRIPLGVTDKDSAIKLAAQAQLRGDQEQAGHDNYAEHRAVPLCNLFRDYFEQDAKRSHDHLWDYKEHLEASGFGTDHIVETIRLIQRICVACTFRYIEEFDTPSLNRYLKDVIRKGRSRRTRNKALQQLKAFIHWMQKCDRMEPVAPFRTIKMLNEQSDPNKRERRALTADELTALMQAAESGPVVKEIEPAERALIYATAATTGLRAIELAKLKVRDLCLDAEVPHINTPASITKNHNQALPPLHPVLVGKFRDLVQGRSSGSPLFNLYTKQGKLKQTWRIIRRDLKLAGVPYKTDDGIADFHALRTTYITNVCRLTDQFTAMRLARHSKATTTARHYDKARLDHLANVVGQLALPAPAKS